MRLWPAGSAVMYFYETGENHLLSNNKFRLSPGAPKALFYCLGFRMIEAYVKSWTKFLERHT